MTDAQAMTSLNTLDRSRNKATMSGREVINAFSGNKTEWDALSATNQDRIISLCSRAELDPFGIDKDIFQDAAAGATNTLADLNAARVETISRGDEIGFGLVLEGHVTYARTL